MVRIAPVRLSFNPRTLWFDAGALELQPDDAVVVSTARGNDFGHIAQPVFEMDYEEVKKLKSPLKPVVRVAGEEDIERANELADLSAQALPIYKQIAAEHAPDMKPIAVEYLFSGEKAVFYFVAEERIDFRDLVRKLASEFNTRVDMKQIGVRDGARMVGGLGHCGQELCCRRLGGEFNPVSIRMAKEQDLSLNPQKISGLCGRLMCCLHYEFDAYKDFHSRAPKKNARIQTPDGEGKVVDMDVPREVISIKVGDEKPVKVPLADMEPPEEGARPNAVGDEAWEIANTPVTYSPIEQLNLFTTQLSGEDKLAEPGKVRRVHDGNDESSGKSSRSRRRRGGSGRAKAASSASASRHGSSNAAPEESASHRKQRRRRSTTVSSDGTTKVVEQPKQDAAKPKETGEGGEAKASKSSSSRRRRSRGRSNAKQTQNANANASSQHEKTVKVGRNSSALRANRPENQKSQGDQKKSQGSQGEQPKRRRRRTHRGNASSGGQKPAE